MHIQTNIGILRGKNGVESNSHRVSKAFLGLVVIPRLRPNRFIQPNLHFFFLHCSPYEFYDTYKHIIHIPPAPSFISLLLTLKSQNTN